MQTRPLTLRRWIRPRELQAWIHAAASAHRGLKLTSLMGGRLGGPLSLRLVATPPLWDCARERSTNNEERVKPSALPAPALSCYSGSHLARPRCCHGQAAWSRRMRSSVAWHRKRDHARRLNRATRRVAGARRRAADGPHSGRRFARSVHAPRLNQRKLFQRRRAVGSVGGKATRCCWCSWRGSACWRGQRGL